MDHDDYAIVITKLNYIIGMLENKIVKQENQIKYCKKLYREEKHKRNDIAKAYNKLVDEMNKNTNKKLEN